MRDLIEEGFLKLVPPPFRLLPHYHRLLCLRFGIFRHEFFRRRLLGGQFSFLNRKDHEILITFDLEVEWSFQKSPSLQIDDLLCHFRSDYEVASTNALTLLIVINHGIEYAASMGGVSLEQFFFSSTIGEVLDVDSEQLLLRVCLQVQQVVHNDLLFLCPSLLLLRLIRIHSRPAEFRLKGVITLTLIILLRQ